jgi:sec-independent protein translocase protein TatA
MPGLHPELIIVVVIALLIFGPKKLPEMGASIGKSIKEFKKGMSELSASKEDDANKPNKAAQMELDAIEREIAQKKATLAAQEAAQTETAAFQNEAVYTDPIHADPVHADTFHADTVAHVE